MNRAALDSELPEDMRRWLRTAGPELCEEIAREIATRASLTLLADPEGWDDDGWRDKLAADPSQLVRAVVGQLPRYQRWSVPTVVAKVTAALDLHGADRDIMNRVRFRIKSHA